MSIYAKSEKQSQLNSKSPGPEGAHSRASPDGLKDKLRALKVFEDKGTGRCCKGSKDVEKCDKSCTLTKFLNRNGKHFSKEVEVTGTVYHIENSVSRRRRLLQRGGARPC